ncbi:RHS repeat-associated core domain-containing protein [Pseudomonas putida]
MRLTGHECSGTQLPLNTFGQPYTKLVITLDGYDNVKTTTYTLSGNPTLQRAIYAYDKDDPCQLKSIQHIGRPLQTVTYDKDGNQEQDERGNTMRYDQQGRLLTVNGSAAPLATYRYDAGGDLYASETQGQQPLTLFFQGDRLALTISDALGSGKSTQLLYGNDQPLAQQTPGDASQTLLLQTNASTTVVSQFRAGTFEGSTYSAYGALPDSQQGHGLLAYNGELRDPGTGWYLLGRGYRAYNPVLMRFHSPDSLCALDEGGSLNPYAYCNGNPVTLRDPTGHVAEGWSGGRLRRPDEDNPLALGGASGSSASVETWIGVGIAALGLLITGGLSAAAFYKGNVLLGATLAASAVASAVSLGTGLAAINDPDPMLSQISFYSGIAAMVIGLPTIFMSGPSTLASGASAARPAVRSLALAVSRVAGSVAGSARSAAPSIMGSISRAAAGARSVVPATGNALSRSTFSGALFISPARHLRGSPFIRSINSPAPAHITLPAKYGNSYLAKQFNSRVFYTNAERFSSQT